MRKKIASTAIAIVLLLQTVVGTGWMSVQAAGEDELTKNIITNAVITINYDDTTVTRSVYDQSDIELDFEWLAGSHIKLEYDWALPEDYDYDRDGYIFKFDLPEQFKLFSGSLQRRPVTALNDYGEEVIIAHFQATADNEVTLEIHSNVKDMYGVSGQMWFDANFNMEEFEYEWSHDIRMDIKDHDYIQFSLGFKPEFTEAFSKTGAAKPGSYNSEYIEWTIDVNTVQEAVYGAVVTDVFPSGVQLDETSVKVYELKVSLDGTRTEVGRELVSSSEYQVTTSDPTVGFEVDLGDIDRAYRIVYETDIIDPNTTSFENAATYTHDDDAVGLTDSDTVNITRGELLAKRSSGYNSTTQTITWQIDYNFGLALLNPAVLRDDFGANQEYVPDTFKLQRVTLDPEGNATDPVNVDSGDYTFTYDPTGFRLEFAGAVESEAYRITYDTKIIDPITSSTTITNTVKDEKYSEGGIGVGASRQIGPVVLHKPCPPASRINYANRTIDWEIQLYGGINRMDQNVVVTDTISEIMKFNESSLKVFNGSNVELDRDDDYELQYTAGSGGFGGHFTVTFEDKVDGTYRITYTTDYEDLVGGIAKFGNEASITWVSNDAGFSSGVYTSGLSVTADCIPITSVVNNGFKDGAYDATNQLINWQVGINYNSMTLTDAILWDRLGPVDDSQEFHPGSVRIYPMTVNSDGSDSFDESAPLSEDDYEVDLVEDGGSNLLKISFNITVDRPYLVAFQTTYQNSLINNATVENIAWLTAGGVKRSNDLMRTVTIPFGGEYVSKSGRQDGDYIDWTIFINRGLSYIDAGAKLIDTPSTNQLLPEDKTGYEVYGTTVSGNGTVVEKNSADLLVEGADYELNVILDEHGHQRVELEFLQAIEHKAYVLEYRATIDAVHLEIVGNEVEFEGQRTDTVTRKESGQLAVSFSSGGATGKGIIRKLEVNKVDAEDATVKLEGATFELRRETSKGSNVYVAFGDSEETNEHGVATFDVLPSGNYQLWEVGAPEGYQLPSGSVYDFSVIATTKNVTIDIPNVKAEGTNKVTVLKVDEDDPAIKLAGAEFRLERKVGLDWVAWGTTQTTDADGELTFTNLLPGDYRVTETVAPEGYLLNSTPREVTIAAGDEVVTFTNKARQLIVEKVDENDPSRKLAGATFRLEKQDGSVWNVVGTSTTDASGVATFKPLASGNYRLIETAAPAGYLLDPTPKEVEILETDESVTESVKNEPVRHLTVIKADENDTSVTLAGAAFRLEMLSGGEWIEVDSGTTDLHGQVVFSELRTGDYRLIETAAPTGYLLDDTPEEFSIIATEVTKTVTVTNEPNRKLTVTKVNEVDPSQTLAGASFVLEMLDGGAWTEIGTGITDANGELVFSELKPGDYRLIETSAPAGYMLDDTPYPITIDAAEVDEKITVDNEPNRELKVTKVDENDTSTTLEGATFFLELLVGGVWDGVGTGTTDANGEVVFSGLKPGEYRLTETAAPAGYLLNDDPKLITIAATDLLTEVEFTNEPNRHLKVTKVDERQTSTVLAGAKFSLEKLDGSTWTVIGDGTTDVSGNLQFSELAPGQYRLIETEAPARYVLNETPHEFTIVADASLTEVTITNRRVSVPWIPPMTPEDPEDPEQPGDSEDPNDPNDPNDSEDPINEEDPEDPDRPEQPSQPEDPTDGDEDERTVRERTEESTPVEGRVGLPEGSIVRLCQEPENGTVTFDEEGRWVYTPAPGFTGQDRFCVTVIDEDGYEEDLFFEIDVDEVPLGTVTVPDEQANQGGLLPKTGEDSKLLYYVFGSLLILAGIAGWVILRRRNSNSTSA